MSRRERLVERLVRTAQQRAAEGNWSSARDAVLDALAVDEHHRRARALLGEIDRHEPTAAGAGVKRQLSVLFCDQVASTSFAARHDPESVGSVLRTYHEIASRAIERYDGHIHGYSGDGILAHFCYPRAHEDDAARAVRAALDLVHDLAPLRDQVARELGDEFHVRIGIETGTVLVGELGSGDAPLPDAAVGVTPSIAARLQDVAPPDGVAVSASTLATTSAFTTRSLGWRQLKGVPEPVEVFSVLGHRSAELAPAPTLAPMVGRDEEIARLEAAWDQVEPGDRGLAVVIEGGPGLGKSRLSRFACGLGARRGARALSCECLPLESGTPLQPVRVGLARYLGLGPDATADERAGTLVEAASALDLDEGTMALIAALLQIDPGPTGISPTELHPTRFHEATLQALTAWVSARAARQPFVLEAADLHWADESTLAWVASLVADPPPGLLVVATSREHQAAFDGADVIPLGPLDDDAARLVAKQLIGDADVDVDEIVARCDGVPLYVDQVARAASRSGEGTIPLGLRDVVQAKLLRPEVDQQLAQVLSTIGRDCTPAFVADVTRRLGHDLAPGDLADGLEGLVRAGLLERVRDGEAYRFSHVLLQEVAYASQLSEARAARHACVADVLAGGSPPADNPRAAVAARHYELGGRPVEAVLHYLGAAERAQAVGAYPDALAQLERGWSLLQALPATARPLLEVAVRMNRGLGVAATRGYAAPEVEEDFAVAGELCGALVEVRELADALAPALVGLWGNRAVRGDLRGSGTVLGQLDRVGRSAQAEGMRPTLYSVRGMDALFRGDVEESARELAIAIDAHADGLPPAQWRLPNDPLAATLVLSSLANSVLGDSARAEAHREAALRRAAALPFPLGRFSEGFVHAYLALTGLVLDEHERQLEHAGAAIAIGQEHGFVDWLATGAMHSLASQALTGSPELVDDLEGATRAWAAAGAGLFVPMFHALIGELRRRLGDLEGALGSIDTAAIAEERGGHAFYAAETRRWRARTLTDLGRDEAAVEELRGAIRLARAQGARLFELRAAIDLARHRPEEGSERVASVRRRAPVGCRWAELAETAPLLAGGA